MSAVNTLAATDSFLEITTAVLAVALIAGAFVGNWWFEKQRRIRKGLEAQVRALTAERSQVTQRGDTQNAVIFEQHRRVNELQIAKLMAEVELLQRQVKSRELEEDRIEASKEYHELMVEKTKLEIDSLRLHIAEIRKRMEDWRSDPD